MENKDFSQLLKNIRTLLSTQHHIFRVTMQNKDIYLPLYDDDEQSYAADLEKRRDYLLKFSSFLMNLLILVDNGMSLEDILVSEMLKADNSEDKELSELTIDFCSKVLEKYIDLSPFEDREE